MAWEMKKAAVCDVCGHVWLAVELPKRCAKCKSSLWNRGGKDAAVEVPEVKVEPVKNFSETPVVVKKEVTGRCELHGCKMMDYGTKWICEGPPPHTVLKG